MPECVDAWGATLKRFTPRHPFTPLSPFSSLSNVPVYRWDVDDVDKRILHSLGFFWSWFVTVTVTVWKNKIRFRHASLGELRQKKKTLKKKLCKLDNNQNRHASCFHADTNQVKSSQKAQQQGKTNYCLAGGVGGENIIIIYFSNPSLDEYRRWNRFVVACLILRDVVSVCGTRG